MSTIHSFKTHKRLDQLNFRHKIELNIASVAVAVEALEQMLVEQGILKDGELMRRIEEVAKTKIAPGGDG